MLRSCAKSVCTLLFQFHVTCDLIFFPFVGSTHRQYQDQAEQLKEDIYA